RVGDNTADACFILPVAYQVHAGLGFLMQGDRTGYLHNIVAAGDGSCVPDPNRGAKRVGRLSYNAPFCAFPQQAGVEEKMTPYGAGLDSGVNDSQGHPICVWNGSKPPPTPNPCLRTVLTKPAGGVVMLVWQVENAVLETAIGPAAPITFDGNTNQ